MDVNSYHLLERMLLLCWVVLQVLASEAFLDTTGNDNTIYDTHARTCTVDVLRTRENDAYNEALKASECLYNSSEHEPGTEALSKRREVLSYVIEDTRKMFQCGANLGPPEEHLWNLYFDPALNSELNGTELRSLDCIFCFLKQFNSMQRACLLALGLDTESCDPETIAPVNLTLWADVANMVKFLFEEISFMEQMATSHDNETSPWVRNFLSTDNWEHFRSAVMTYAVTLLANSERSYGLTVFLLVLHGTLFVVGIVGNFLLLLTFAQHRSLLTSQNVIVLTLVIGDSLSLCSNLLVSYVFILSSSSMAHLVCLSITLFVPLCTGVCVYSVAMLSVQRYLATAPEGAGSKTCQFFRKHSPVLFVAAVWVLALASALPQFLRTEFHDHYCAVQLTRFSILFDLVVYCVIPVLTITSLTIVMSLRLRGSTKCMQRERVTQNILIALVVVFAVSYVPHYLLLFAYEYLQLDLAGFDTMFIVSHTLIFLNSCCNPIALYAASATIRGHVNNYLRCRCVRKSDSCDLNSKISSVASTEL